MIQDFPRGYDEIGETLARPVTEGYRPVTWASDIASVLGYNLREVRAWLRHYEEQNAEELKRLRNRRKAKQRKIKNKRKQIRELLMSQEPEA